MTHRQLPLAVLVAAILLDAAAGSEMARWTGTLELPKTSPRRSNMAYAWIPEGCRVVQGVLITQHTMFEAQITRSEEVRAACAAKDIAVVYAPCGIGSNFITGDSAERLDAILTGLGEVTRHAELQSVPLITAGHSAGGIYCRNVAYWQPDRVAGMLHLMSGNLQAHIEDTNRSLAGVPMLCINGEWEQFGPDGGDLPRNLRSNMGLRMRGDQQQSQTQWICMRQQILARREKNTDNLMGLVVSRDKNHTEWEDAMNGMVAQFIRSVADLRIGPSDPEGKIKTRCLPTTAEQGWLLDADIKSPRFEPAPYAEYEGDKQRALWYPDEKMALLVWRYHQQGWADPDPTADRPVDERYTPPPCLQDIVDSPTPPKLTWSGGDGVWDDTTDAWRDEAGNMVAWDPQAQAVLSGRGGTVRAAAKIVCSGLTLGKGYTLALGSHAVESRMFVVLEPGSTLEVTLKPKDANGRWGARISAAGHATIGGTLVLDGADLQSGSYRIVRASGKNEGQFDKVAAPEGWTTRGGGGSVTLKTKAAKN